MIEIIRRHIGYHSGQHEFILDAHIGGKDTPAVGFLLYAEFEGQPFVMNMEAYRKREGIGTALVVALQNEYPDKVINFGILKPDGAALLSSLEWKEVPNAALANATAELIATREKLAIYSKKADDLKNASPPEKDAFFRECADWNDLWDRADELERIIADAPASFRYIVGPRPKEPAPGIRM